MCYSFYDCITNLVFRRLIKELIAFDQVTAFAHKDTLEFLISVALHLSIFGLLRGGMVLFEGTKVIDFIENFSA